MFPMMRSYILLSTLLLNTFISGSCKKDPESSIPEIKIDSSVLQVAEDSPISSAELDVYLSGTSDKVVSIDYSTADSTAIAGKDYVAVSSGKLVFQPGEVLKNIKINILSDTAQKQNVVFKVVLNNPVNCTLPGSDFKVRILNVDYSTLVWSDEFNSGQLNTAVWNYELGAGGWGNNELQSYTSSLNNVHIDSGYLHISVLNPYGSTYTSGRITTKGKKEFTYFRVNIRARVPEGQGVWPALWALGGNISTVNWPKCGEIDIMELLGQTPATVYGTVHWDANGHQMRGSSYSLSSGKFSSGFHVFSLIWTPGRFKWLIDNREYYSLNKAEISAFPFDLPEFFIFNVAVGGNWPGSPDQTTVFPQHLIVDYIRVYK
jgi:beta-glucanase (GH16 family)